jgi:putative transposase
MARRLREDVAGGIHHVVAKGNAGAAIVADDLDRNAFVGRLAKTVERSGWACLSYCLLDTHVHLVVGTPRPNLGAGMQWLLGAYAQNFNHRHDREGHLFRARFYSRRIQSESHLVSTLAYVALNPVRAGVVERPEQWRWSSYAATVGRSRAPGFFDPRAVLQLVDWDPVRAQLRFELAVADARSRDREDTRT